MFGTSKNVLRIALRVLVGCVLAIVILGKGSETDNVFGPGGAPQFLAVVSGLCLLIILKAGSELIAEHRTRAKADEEVVDELKKWKARVAPDLPAPIPGRTGRIGGVESIQIDGEMLFFGFDYGEGLVLSPLIADKQLMAVFAATYIELRDDTPRDSSFWLTEIVEVAVHDSALTDREGGIFSSSQLRSIPQLLKTVVENNCPEPALTLHSHLLYLLGAAVGEIDAKLERTPELERLATDHEWEFGPADIEYLLALARGEKPLPLGGSYRDVALVLQAYLRRTRQRLPGNWATVFSPLVGEDAEPSHA